MLIDLGNNTDSEKLGKVIDFLLNIDIEFKLLDIELKEGEYNLITNN